MAQNVEYISNEG